MSAAYAWVLTVIYSNIWSQSLLFIFSYQALKDKTFLEVINKYVEVHATVGGEVSTLLLA